MIRIVLSDHALRMTEPRPDGNREYWQVSDESNSIKLPVARMPVRTAQAIEFEPGDDDHEHVEHRQDQEPG